jgi:hypothetical protein
MEREITDGNFQRQKASINPNHNPMGDFLCLASLDSSTQPF